MTVTSVKYSVMVLGVGCELIQQRGLVSHIASETELSSLPTCQESACRKRRVISSVKIVVFSLGSCTWASSRASSLSLHMTSVKVSRKVLRNRCPTVRVDFQFSNQALVA